MIANKVRFGHDEALELARQGNEVWAAKGKQVTKYALADDPGDEELAAILLGPSGKLRAPAMRVGKRFVVGFNPDMYAELF